jgi:O-antigen ligase/tetratricopeptide (TPR) repeat protein
LREGSPTWAPISIDPTATRIEVLKGVAYLLAFVTALRVARRRSGVAFLSRTVIITGLALGVSALLHPAFGAHKVYGVWEPRAHNEVYLRHLAPLLNPNNLAGYLNVALCLAFAATLAPEPYWPRWILAAIAILLTATQVWVASRGGVLAMVVGATLVLAMSRGVRLRRERRGVRIPVVAGLGAAVGAAAIVLAISEQSTSELLDSDISKVQLVFQAMQMLRAYGIWGTGRGAFESAFPAFRQARGPHVWHATFTHPENIVAQWLVEWGAPLGIAAIAAIVVALRPSAALTRSSAAVGAWSAIVAFAVQNLADLGSEVPGLMLAPVVCAAIFTGGTAGQNPDWVVERWASMPRAVGAVALVAVVCALLAGARSIGHELRDDRDRMREAAIIRRASPGEIDALARTTMLRHPAEPFLPFIVAVSRSGPVHQEGSPLPWIEATLERANVYGPAHLLLARWLAPRFPAQARLEYRLTVEQANELDGVAIEEGASLVADYDDASDMVAAAGTRELTPLREAIEGRLPATAERLDEEIARRAPEDAGPVLRSAKAAVNDLIEGADAPWCHGAGRDACKNAALAQTNVLERLLPSACEPRILRAQALTETGHVDQALSGLEGATESVTERGPCFQALFSMAQAAGNERVATHALERLANMGCADDGACANNLAWVAAAEERRGNTRKALALYTRAYERAPDADEPLESMARLAAATGLHAAAADDYERLARRHPDDKKWQRAVTEQRGAAVKEPLPQ